MPDFLLEIGCEEIPARMIDAAALELDERIYRLLVNERLVEFESIPAIGLGESWQSFSTPRRISALIEEVLCTQPDLDEQLQGPAVKIAYKDGVPTPAAEAFAKKVGVDVARLEKITTAKGEYLSARVVKKGRAAKEVLSELLPKEIAGIYWSKSMYWRSGAPERFVRPIRWIVALLDSEVIPLEFAGVQAGNISHGHRFFSKGVRIASPNAYQSELEKAKVIVDRDEREQRIRQALDSVTRAIPDARWREDKELLNTVVNLTEWPAVILGSFEKEYLALPEEVLVTVMRDHQKYFALEDATGKLAPHFLAVLNTDGDPEGLIRHGNERVLRARFNDARFFWTIDQKTPMRNRVDMLKSVTFQKDLGSYYQKTERVAALAEKIAEELNDEGANINIEATAEAAWLAKTDLTTELVKEFTELQGIVGGLYAQHQKLAKPVADAIYDHYKPASMEDAVPRTLEGATLSIADKADSIAGMFALGLQPTGSKDPFALRRQANGIVKIIAEHKLNIGFRQLFMDASHNYKNSEAASKFCEPSKTETLLAAFLRERLEFYLRETRGFSYDIVNAVLAVDSDNAVDVIARAEAVREARKNPDFESICTVFNRTKGILEQARAKQFEIGPFSPKLEPSELEFFNRTEEAGAGFANYIKQGDYANALQLMVKLRKPIDDYFDHIMVMVDDPELRKNRLGFIERFQKVFAGIADFSEIVPEKK